MSAIRQDVEIDFILPNLKAKTIKQVIQDLAVAMANKISCAPDVLAELMMQKEMHEGSGIGEGIALPDLQLDHLHQPYTVLAVLDKGLDFNAADRRPVDIVCVVVSPAKDGPLHLRRLARVTRFLQNDDLCAKIREAKDTDVIRALLMAPDGMMLAA